MKKNKKKKFFSIKIFFLKISLFIIITFFSIIWITYAIDVIWDYIKTQISTWTWTNSNKIIFSNKKTTYYINKDDDNILIWDQLRWYYYDNIYWYFRLDWSQDLARNVYINDWPYNIWWCNEAYSFTWSAYSKYMWYIDFYYDSNNFVYYCNDDDKKIIYWTGYTELLWKQIFDWIKINIRKKQIINDITEKVITQDDNNYIENTGSIQSNYNWNNNNIWGGDKYEIENSTINKLEWNVFWIIK